MPTLEVLDTLQAIIEKLTRLSDVERGDPLRSSDWNTLVDCIRNIATTILDREASATVADHDHPDQVSLDWFDPNLKQLMEKGPLNEPGALTRLGKLERELKRLQAHLDKSQNQLSKVRGNVFDIGTAKIGQEGRLKNLELRLKNLPDARQDVLSLNQRVAGMASKLDETLAFEERLNLNGEPLNFGEIKEELDKAKELREGLTDESGNLWTADSIRRQLTGLQNKLVTQEDLELAFERLETGGPILDPRIEALLETRVKSLVDERLVDNPSGVDPTILTRLDTLAEGQREQGAMLDGMENRIDATPTLDQIEGLTKRVSQTQTSLNNAQRTNKTLLTSFGQITQFLQDFSDPPVPGTPSRPFDVRSLRFNVAINNHPKLGEKLRASQITSVEQLARLSPSSLNKLMRDIVAPVDAEIIRNNIQTLSLG